MCYERLPAELPNGKCTQNSQKASGWPLILQIKDMPGVPLGSLGLSEITVIGKCVIISFVL